MKVISLVLIVLALLQSTILPLDLVLVVLICRSYIKEGKENLYLAFFIGLLTSHLNLQPLGVMSIVYLVLVQITQMVSKSPLAGNSLIIVPLSFSLFLIAEAANFFTLNQNLQFSKVLIETAISLPTLFLVRLWEERFVVSDIKLKI